MTLALSDALFFNQTHDTFRRLYDSKLRVFEVFSAQIEIESLDFFVALSSVTGLIGVPGVSNYASACTALDGVLARYPNAFSLITPGILDVGYIVSLLNDSDSLFEFFLQLVLGSHGLQPCCEGRADGLAKMDDRPFNQYIPDLDWTSVDQHF
ncbi:hypothetical protein B0H14DRAFT_2311976, partial [Mycena olivaceomarginata]